MKQIMATRIMHWKKHMVSLVFWLLFPLLATVGMTMLIDTLKEDANVPVGVVMEETSPSAKALVDELNASSFIRMQKLPEREALNDLKKHNLDSVFVIHDGFEQAIEADNRNRLITAYQSDQSFAYTPVKEKVISHVQQATGRSKAAFAVQELEKQYNGEQGWIRQAIKEKSKQIQQEEDLLTIDLDFKGVSNTADDDPRLFPVWSLWGIFSLLSTLLVFDWVIKEKRSKAIQRLAFSRWSLKSYLLQHFILHTGLLLVIDLFTAVSLYLIFGEWISLVNLFVYRLLINMAAFLFAGLFSRSFYYYTLSFALVLIVGISSGTLLRSTNLLNWNRFDSINPLAPLLLGDYLSLWSAGVVLLFVVWLFRKERYHA